MGREPIRTIRTEKNNLKKKMEQTKKSHSVLALLLVQVFLWMACGTPEKTLDLQNEPSCPQWVDGGADARPRYYCYELAMEGELVEVAFSEENSSDPRLEYYFPLENADSSFWSQARIIGFPGATFCSFYHESDTIWGVIASLNKVAYSAWEGDSLFEQLIISYQPDGSHYEQMGPFEFVRVSFRQLADATYRFTFRINHSTFLSYNFEFVSESGRCDSPRIMYFDAVRKRIQSQYSGCYWVFKADS